MYELIISSYLVFLRDKTHKQIHEDFNLAKELEVKEVWKPLPKEQVVETDEYGACSSKNVINSITIPNDNISSTASVADDQVIAQLLQAEFDLEFDEEIKRLEQSRNKSNIAKYIKCT